MQSLHPNVEEEANRRQICASGSGEGTATYSEAFQVINQTCMWGTAVVGIIVGLCQHCLLWFQQQHILVLATRYFCYALKQSSLEHGISGNVVALEV